jgi:hypothetical protein
MSTAFVRSAIWGSVQKRTRSMQQETLESGRSDKVQRNEMTAL